MSKVPQHGSLEETAWQDESQIAGRLAELSEFTRSKGYVHTARMIEEALNAYSFERRHLGVAETYLAELQQVKGIEVPQSVEGSARKQRRVPSFRSSRSAKSNSLPSDKTKLLAGQALAEGATQRQAALVLTSRMRVDGRNVAVLRGGHRKGKPMSFPAEPEFQFR